MLFPERRFRLFDDFFQDDFFTSKANQMMSADIRETENGYMIDMNVPGYQKEDLTMHLDNGYLTVSASKNTDNSTKDNQGRIISQERYYGSCSRSFYVGDKITEEDIKASYQNGVLTVNIPKKEAIENDTKKYIQID